MSDETTAKPDETVIAAKTVETDTSQTVLDDDDIIFTQDEMDTAEPDPVMVILALNEENTELKSKAMTLLADMENLRRRTEREVKDARQYAVASFARDILSVSDNLSRALQAIPQEARVDADEVLKNLLEGVEMTDRDLQNQLTKNGVIQLDPEGEKFNPNFHQAIFEVPDPDVISGTIVQVVQAGYKIGERVLRPAMVGVAKGGPKGGSKAEPQLKAVEPGETVNKSV